LIKSYPEKDGVLIRGVDNLRRKTWEHFEGLVNRNPDIEDP